jgi:predicted RNA-binding protein with TRAM domain
MRYNYMANNLTKNQEILLSIKRVGINGEGIGYYRRLAVFVPGALPGEDAVVKMLTGTIQDGKVVTSATPVTATWSQDMNTITFDSNYLLVGGVYGVSGKYYGYWNAYDKVVLTRKK